MSDKHIVNNFIWKYLERCFYQIGLALINIILARILVPEDFGELAIIMVFVNVAQTFVQQGLATALIREKSIDNRDTANILAANLSVAAVLYMFFYASAPLIADFYNMPDLIWNIRFMSLVLLPGSINAIQNSIIVRGGKYKELCFANAGSVAVSGVIGYIAALSNMGVRALIFQQFSFQIIVCVIMMPITKIKLCMPKYDEKFWQMYKFGLKLMVSSFLNNLYIEAQTLIVGKAYNNTSVGYYNQGKTYPTLVINNINATMNTILLPEFAHLSSKENGIKDAMRKSLCLGALIISPLLLGLLGVADNLIAVLLTDKWANCVPYMRLFCLGYVFTPLSTINLQAYSAIGRSDIYLKNEIAKKIIGVSLLVAFMIIWHSPLAVAASFCVLSPVCSMIDMQKSKELFKYPFTEQLGDVMPSIIAATVMMLTVMGLNFIQLPKLPLLILQVIMGIGIYVGAALLFHIPGTAALVRLGKVFFCHKFKK